MRYVAIALLLLLLAALPTFAAEPVFSGSVRARVEDWSWFDTGGDGEDDYTFLGAQIRLAAKKKLGSFEGQVELAAPVLVNLPERAVLAAPRGQLGLGGSYYAANRDDTAAGLFIKQAFLRTGAWRFGRFEFSDGLENVPADAQLAAVRRDRVAHRLVGTFGFSHVGRSYDGVHFGARNWTIVAARPTAGVFNVQGWPQVDVDLLYGSWVRGSATSDARVFAIAYRDHRNLVKTDNRPAAVRNLDRERVEIGTIGGHAIAKFGKANVLFWGAAQFGDWGTLDHQAFAFDVEAGTELTKTTALRAGWYRSTGDDDPLDDEHETFFQILPTPRIYARFPFYNAMNSSDAFVQLAVKPHAKVTLQSELHRLALTSDRDLWYSGGGAFEKGSFGYAGRPSSGSDDLAHVIDVSALYKPNAATDVTFYVGRAFGGDVVSSIFAGDSAAYVYVEVVRRF